MRIGTLACFHISRWMIRGRAQWQSENRKKFSSVETYSGWRDDALREQFLSHFSPAMIKGREVLDLGCGSGGLSLYIATLEPKRVIGIDVHSDTIEIARAHANQDTNPLKPEFMVATNHTSIDLPDASIDVILCFDVLEHIRQYEKIIAEWLRVLRDGGRVLIWWMPWWHPYGHHVTRFIPLPWAHVVFSEKTIVETCALIYDLPEYQPLYGELDEKGQKRPNIWHKAERLADLNRLTIGGFEALCARYGFKIESVKYHGFGSSRLARLTHVFTRIPFLREFFCSCVVYVLRK